MSLYLGKDNNGNNIMHATSSTTDINTLKSGVNSSTIFHSSLPYVQQVYTEVIPTYRNAWFNGQWYVYTFTAQLSDTIINYINQGYLFDIITSTSNSSGTPVTLNFCSTFDKMGRQWTYNGTYFFSTYSYGSTSNGWDWASSAAAFPSSTNRYISLRNTRMTTYNNVLYGGPSPDTITGATYIIVYNLNLNGVLNTITSTHINISKSNFTIGASSGNTIDLSTFSPIRGSYTSNTGYVYTSDSFYIKPYLPVVNAPYSWSIETKPFVRISKSNSGISETLVGVGINNLVLQSTEVIPYSISTNKNTSTINLGRSIPSGGCISIFNSGSFSNGYLNNAPTGGRIMLCTSGDNIIVKGYTARSTNGYEIFGDYWLNIQIVNGNIVLKSSSSNGVANAMDTGTFSGNLTILYFSIT